MAEDEVIEIVGARKEQAAEIASLIMEAMDYDCCQNFAGEAHTLEDFHRMMTSLVEMDDSQYSYRNTLVALVDGQLAGCLVGYGGKDLQRLRKRFIEKAAEYLEQDFSNMDDETQAGEYYLDSLCVKKNFRKRGLATRLIKEAIKRHGSQPVGLLVDHTHPWAERLYRAIGFEFVNETTWGGHAMNHLQYPTRKESLKE
jgi:DNA-3-methyladenine glycosylase I